MIALCFLLALAGLALMGLSQNQHHGAVLHRKLPSRQARLCRDGGLAITVLSLWPAISGWGAASGIVAWCGILSLSAALLLLARTYGLPARAGAKPKPAGD